MFLISENYNTMHTDQAQIEIEWKVKKINI
jgi:hypothetical protein